jgi:hypothetical protein
MDRNRDNVGHVLLQGPGHDMDHYLDHGLAGAMKRCAHHFGMDDGPVGDIVYVRKDAAAAAAAERTGEAWLVPLIFLTAA